MDGTPQEPLETTGPKVPAQHTPMPTGIAPGADDDEIDLGQLVGVIWQGKVIITICAAIGIAFGAFMIANTNPTFQSDALLQLEEKSGALALPGSLSGLLDNDPRSVTEIELLRSRMVLGQAVADLDLDWRVSQDLFPVIGTMVSRYDLPVLNTILPQRFARRGDRLEIEELVVPPDWLNQRMTLVVTEEGRFRITLPDGNRIDAGVGERITLPETGFALRLAELEAEPGRHFNLSQLDELRAIRSLRAQLNVSERGRSSGILEVRLSGHDRRDNTRALNAIVEAYQRQNIARSAAQAEGSLDFIREQLPQAESKLRAAEAALNAFRQEQVTVDLSAETQTVLSQVTSIESQLAALERREDELSQRFTEAHPSYRQLLDERARLESRLERLRERVSELPETQRQILNLTRELELAQGIYTQLLTRAQAIEVLRASTIGNVRILDAAVSATAPVAPRKSLIFALSVALSVMAGIALVLLRNWLRRGIQDGSDLEQLGLPLFATVQYSRIADTEGKRKGRLPILALEAPTDLTVESLRSLRTSLHFGMLDASTPTLSITSSHPLAGKSFLAVNLGVVAAQAGQKICLIDADLRRGQLRRFFDLPRDQPGLAEVLAG